MSSPVRGHQPRRTGPAAALTLLAAALAMVLASSGPVNAAVRAGHPAGKPVPSHRVPGLVRPGRVPPQAPAPHHLLPASKAVAVKRRERPREHYSAAMRADIAAAVRAERTGHPVIVGSQTTDTLEVLAHPDGRFEFISNALPVRVQVHGRWVQISTSLRRDSDGSWTAALTSAPVTFSGGGTGTLAVVTDPATGRSVSVSVPFDLPRPRVTGSVALYPDVLPGVDLRLQATSTGYQEVLVIHNAAAAADPRLRALTFTLRGGPGVTLRRGQDGAVTAVDSATGKTLFTSGRPMMWDSSRSGPIHAAPSAGYSGSGRVFGVPVLATKISRTGQSTAALTLAVPTTAPTGSKIKFPEYVDPEISDNSSTQYYAQVANFGGFWTTTTATTSVGNGIVEVGDCAYSDCGYDWDGTDYSSYVDRVYFRMNTAPLAKRNGFVASVYSATFFADEVTNSNGCTAQDVALYEAGTISSSTRWGGPEGSLIGEAASAAGGGSGCKAGDVDLNATSYFQADEGVGPTNLTFELRAPSESNELQYKAFTDNPSLDVYYNFAPLTPTGLGVSDAVTCTSTTYTSQSEPSLTATGKDNNPSPLNLDYNFTLDTASGTLVKSAKLTNGTAGYASGTAAAWNAEGTLTSGDAYKYDVYSTNVLTSGDKSGTRNSPVTGTYSFTDLSTPPSAAPVISSFDFPAGQWGQPSGAPGVLNADTNGAANIAGFAYSFDGGSGSEPVPDTADCKYLTDGGLGTSANATGGGNANGELELAAGNSAQIQVPANLTPGQHTLYVRSFDYAHNASPESAYVFYVAPNYQNTSQPVTYTDASTLAASATGTSASLVSSQAQTCCGITTWRGGSQLLFNAGAVGQTFTIPLTVPASGTWQLGADMTTGPHYGQAAVTLDQATSDVPLGGTGTVAFDGYNPVESNAYTDLGTQTLTAGTHTLTFTVTGQNPSALGFQLGINYLTLSPTGRYDATSLTWSGTNTAGSLAPQCFDEPAWSDNCQLFLGNTAPGTSFTVSFDAPVESDYALGVNLTSADDYGELRFDLDPASGDINLDDTAADPLDAYSPAVSASYVFLGAAHLTAGVHVLKVTVTGTDASSVGDRYNAGINFVQAVPVTGATDASFTSAMNNLGLISDGTPVTGRTGNFDLNDDASGGNLSVQALAAAGITPGTATGPGGTFSLNGATFTMPQLSASGGVASYDNVMPDGQTIPLPAVQATGVALLVAATCGATPAATATLNYSGAQSSNAAIPSVPDWLAGPSSGSVLTLSYYDSGSTVNASSRPRLFEVMLPANPTAPLASITLPVMTANFLTNTESCTASNVLHVLAIGTRTVPGGPSGSVWTGAYSAPMDATALQGLPMTNETLREVVPLSSDGSGYVRIHLSNAHADTPVTFDEATVAAQAAAGGPVTVAAPAEVTFGASSSDSVTIPAGGDAWSNPVALPSMTGGTGELTVSVHIPASDTVTAGAIHDSSNLGTFYAVGNDTTDQAGTDDFSNTDSLSGQYFLAGVDVSQSAGSADGTIAVLGDQTATQAPAWTYGNWSSDLPSVFKTAGVQLPGSIADAATSDGQPSDWWQLNGSGYDTSSVAYDSGSVGTDNLTLDGGPQWLAQHPPAGPSAGSLDLNGTSQYAVTAGPVITSATGGFAVSAWVNLSSLPARNATVLAQDGSSESGFYLGYSSSHGGDWMFSFAGSDASSASMTSVYGPAAVAGAWTHLAGIYNPLAGTIDLFVNGVQVASTAFNPSWMSTGGFTVGRDLTNGTDADFFPGLISDVRAYNSATMWEFQVSESYNDTGLSAITTGNAPAAFENDAAVEPNLRDVIVSLGAGDVLKGVPSATIEHNLQALVSDIQGRYDNDTGTPVQALLTTIPPLDLASSDPREAVRQAVNAWIMSGGTTALLPLDIAGAVDAGPLAPNDVAAKYLTGGVPNAAYYSAIASAVANGIDTAIPPVSL